MTTEFNGSNAENLISKNKNLKLEEKSAEPKDSFVFYRSFAETVKMLPKMTDRYNLVMAIIDFALDGTENEDLPLAAKMAMHQIAASIDGAQKRRAASVANGKKGGAPRGNKNARKNNPKQPKTSENNLNVNVNDNDNENVNDNYHYHDNNKEGGNNSEGILSPSLPQDGYLLNGFWCFDRVKDGKRIIYRVPADEPAGQEVQDA